MKSKSGIETYHENGEWKSRTQGASRAFDVGGTKAEQQAKGRARAKRDGLEHFIKNQDGRISQKNSYGSDPQSSKG